MTTFKILVPLGYLKSNVSAVINYYLYKGLPLPQVSPRCHVGENQASYLGPAEVVKRT